jgi:starch synthase
MANPDWVSVPLEGWCLFEALARKADVHLVTHVRNEENILRKGVPLDHLTIVDNRSVESPLMAFANFLRGTRERGGVGQTLITAVSALAYYRFEQLLWRHVGERIRSGSFDVVHRLTPLSPTIPSLIAARCARAGVPFVIGPLNGGLPWPRVFSKERRREREWLTYVRDLYRLLPAYRSTRSAASAIIAGSADTRAQLGSRYQERTVYVPENGVDPARFGAPSPRPSSIPLRLIFVGRMVPYKMPRLLLSAALPFLRRGEVVLDFIGDGPELPGLRQAAASEGVDGAVRFAGWLQHAEVRKRLEAADVFAFPSIREFGGGVVLEAMATGLVPIVVDYGGPGELVSPNTGFAVPLGSAESIVAGFQEVIGRLVARPDSIRPMGLRARARALGQFTWDAKADQVLEVYRWVLGKRGKVDFGMPLPEAPEHAPS